MKKIIIILVGLVLTGFGILYFFRDNGDTSISKYSKNLFYMDTYISITIYSDEEEKVDSAFDYIDNIYSEYHKLTDRYNAYDGVVNVHYINNVLKEDAWIGADKKLYDIIEYSLNYYLESNGRINIAMGNVIDVWKEYRDSGDGIPTFDELDLNTNINDFVLDNGVFMKSGDVSIDLGAISKGYVTSIVSDYLKGIGLETFIIDAGGNVVTGKHYDGSKYKVGIETPKKDVSDLYKIVNVENTSVITSGGYARYYEYEGEIYHHIIDPETNMPPKNMLSVTVITDDSKFGDVLSTSLFLMSIEEGIEYVNSLFDVEAVWYDFDDEIYTSNGFDKYE